MNSVSTLPKSSDMMVTIGNFFCLFLLDSVASDMLKIAWGPNKNSDVHNPRPLL